MNSAPRDRRAWLSRALFLVLTVICVAGLMAAQGGGGFGGGGGRGGGRGGGGGGRGGGGRGEQKKEQADPDKTEYIQLCRSLGLSEEQLEKAMGLYGRCEAQKDTLRASQETGALNVFEVEQKMDEIDKQLEKDFGALLEDSQRAALKELRRKKGAVPW
ncbi:hypothetical protein LLH00_19560 [bacterium]|nr:hypothetical protein [bacterium]